MLIQALLVLATMLQVVAVVYGAVLMMGPRGARGAWFFLIGAMLSMLAWRIFVTTGLQPPGFFNPAIALWGSTCMLVAMVLFAREVARRERAERERDALLDSERAARAEAERSGRLKDEFLATLSHELRTPLTAILGWCSLLRQRRLEPQDVTRAIETVERNARAQARLVDDLLDATRIQAGNLYLEHDLIDLNTPVLAAVDATTPMADAKGVTIRASAADRPVLVSADSGRLQQVAMNLLTNAVKFTPAGGLVRVRVDATAHHARFIVTDTGEGISPSFLPHVFARFRQADGSVARRHGGLGLGLSIVLSLARLHGGDVQAESDGPGRGATFTVTLPLADALAPSSASAPPLETPQMAAAPGALEGIRVLLVDDDTDVRTVVATMLESVGAQVRALESGAAVQYTLARMQPHVLVIDIGLPDEDGYSLIRRIRQLPAGDGGRTPAVSLTAHARNEDRARAMTSGFQEHLPKPVDLPLLVATLRRLATESREVAI